MSITMGFFQIPSDSLNVVLFNEMIKMQSMLSSQNTMEALPSTGHRSVPSPESVPGTKQALVSQLMASMH